MDTIINPLYDFQGYWFIGIIHPHQLSILFVILATGALWDDHPSATILAHQYHVLSRAALSLSPIAHEVNTFTVQALFTLIRFIHTADTNATEERWLLGGICTRAAQIVTPCKFSAEF